MSLKIRSTVPLLVSTLLVVLVALVLPAWSQTGISRPKLLKPTPQINKAALEPERTFYRPIRMPIESLDFGSADNSVERKIAAHTLRGAASAFMVLSPEGIREFDASASFSFRLYDSVKGQHYTQMTEPPPTPNHNLVPSVLDPFNRTCYWFESENKTNRVMLAVDEKSRTIKAMLTRVWRKNPNDGTPLITGEFCGVFALRVEVAYHGPKVTHIGDTVFRLYSLGEVKDTDSLLLMTRNMFYQPVY